MRSDLYAAAFSTSRLWEALSPSTSFKMATTNSRPQMLSTFEPFQRLPSELRHEIWSLALPSSASTVKILIEFGDEGRSAAKRDIPPLLHCCHESRAMALDYYKLGFEMKSLWWGWNHSDCSNELVKGKLNRQLYWDPKEDVVCFEELGETPKISYSPGATCEFCDHYIGAIDPDVRKLEMSEDLWKSLNHLTSNGFPALENITIVLANDFRSRSRIDASVTEDEYSNTCRALVQRCMPPSVQCHVRFEGVEADSGAGQNGE